MLEEDGALGPGAAFQDGVAVVVGGGGGFESWLPGGEILGGEEAAVAAAGGVEDGLGGEEAADGFGDEALIPGAVSGLDAPLPGGAGGFAADAVVGRGKDRVAEEGAGLGRLAVREEDCSAGGPLGLEQGAHGLDGGGDAGDEGHAVLGVADGVGEDVRKLPGAVVAEEAAPGAECAGDGGGQEAGAGDEV